MLIRVGKLLILLSLLGFNVWGQTEYTTRYIYDNKGQLRAVIIQNGEAAIYDYDPAGNFTAIRRLTPTDYELLEFSPRAGPIDALVTLYGVGLNNEVSQVLFSNNTPAQIISQTMTSVIVKVPSGATDGPITVSTPRGTRSTLQSFTVKGMTISPSSITLLTGRSIHFVANRSGLIDSELIWTVNGVPNGSINWGIITQDGYYTAPAVNESGISQFTVRATSVNEPTISAEAIVSVPGTGYDVFSRNLTVRYGQLPTIGPVFHPARSVSVRYGPPPATAPGFIQSKPLLIRYGELPNNVSISIDTRVAVTVGPVIHSITPMVLSRGTIQSVTISGSNLLGTNTIKFYTQAGQIDPDITATNITVASDGTSATATINVLNNAIAGTRVVWINSTFGRTPVNSTNSNTISIVE